MQPISLDDHGVPEGDRIPSLKSHREALEQESGIPKAIWYSWCIL